MTSDAAELLVRLVIAASPGERDVLFALGDGASPEQAAERLGVSRATLDVRLHRLRRRAERLIRD